MARSRTLILMMTAALALPVTAAAQLPRRGGWTVQPPQSQEGYREGFIRGERAGQEDARRREAFRFTDESDYRRGDVGYRPAYGSREQYRSDFRYGFEAGYRRGYESYSVPPSRGRVGGAPPWAGGRGVARFDLAFDNGYKDGYEAGLDDGRARRRADPLSERRYRNADHGYERWYGPKESYQINYREAFKTGYARGYQDAVRYR